MTDLNALLDAHRAAAGGGAAPNTGVDPNAALDAHRAATASVDTPAPAPTAADGMSGLDKFLVGFSSMPSYTARAAKQGFHELNNALYKAVDASDATPGDPEALAAARAKNDEDLQSLYKEQQEVKLRDAPVMDSLPGMAGSIVSNALPFVAASGLTGGASAIPEASATGARLAALGLRMVGNGGLGAIQSLLTPGTSADDRVNNAEWSGGISAAVPVLGSAMRTVVGRMDPAREAMVKTLRNAGVKVRGSAEYGGALNTASDFVLNHIPYLGGMLRQGVEDSRGKVANTLASMASGQADEVMPDTVEAAKNIVSKAGTRLGSMYKGIIVDPSAPAKVAEDILNGGQANIDPTILSGKARKALGYAVDTGKNWSAVTASNARDAIDDLNSVAKKSGASGKAARVVRDAWQSATDAAMGPDAVAQATDLKARYALAKRLKESVGVGADSLESLHKRMVKSGASLPPEAMDLADAASEIIPRAKAPNQFATAGLMTPALYALYHSPALAGAIMAGAPVAKSLLNFPGSPLQRSANSPTGRALTAAILRSAIANQVENTNASGQ